MDIHTLKAGDTFSNGTEALPAIAFFIGTDDGYRIAVTSETDENDSNILSVAAELANRWNAYETLVRLLQCFVSQNGGDPSDMLEGDDPMRTVYERAHLELAALEQHPRYKKTSFETLVKTLQFPITPIQS